MSLTLTLTPSGHLVCEPAGAGDALTTADPSLTPQWSERLSEGFARSTADGLFILAEPLSARLSAPVFVYWRTWVRRFLRSISALSPDEIGALERGESRAARAARKSDRDAGSPGAATVGEVIPPMPDDLTLAVTVSDAPPFRGLEYLTSDILRRFWRELSARFGELAQEADGGVVALLRRLHPEAHLLGRVTLHLAENKSDPDRPFAFLATYAERLSSRARVQHRPLAQALQQYAAEGDQTKLAELLAPVRQAAGRSAVVRGLLESRALFSPQAWTIGEAYRFLSEVDGMEQSGLAVRVPDWWQVRRAPRPQLQIRLGHAPASGGVGLDALLDFEASLTLEGVPLTDEEREELLASSDGLMRLRGRWIEVDRDRLQEALEHWKRLRRLHAEGISFLEGMRLLAGTSLLPESDAGEAREGWSRVVAGRWLEETLRGLREPGEAAGCEPGRDLRATLRPYQAAGVRWLWLLAQLGLGGCLADDMGLGKTIQVIDLILQLKAQRTLPTGRSKDAARRGAASGADGSRGVLLVVPASLVANWRLELTRFAPQLSALYAHRSESDAQTLARLQRDPGGAAARYDVVVTTYHMIRGGKWADQVAWRLLVIDEAQAIKNAGSAQSRSVRRLRGATRIALTGTPVENHLGDLWSLFDFCCPGLLGSWSDFRKFVKRIAQQPDAGGYGRLRRLVRPYILRRLKTDPAVVPDLPEKIELRVACGLSRKQAVLYEQIVRASEVQLQEADGMQRRGLVLSLLMRLKQLCNHPAHYLGQSLFPPEESGKFVALREICAPIAERQEKLLVFTQFQTMCQPLADYLQTLLGRRGLVLHGSVPVAQRRRRVDQFQEQDETAYLVVSLKTGGTGLNLTAASHVVHFDRWWNPAVENQATDRAFRIGQRRNVVVHKFVCQGTLEERIDEMIRGKLEIAQSLLSADGEKMLTEMSNDELLRFVALDLSRSDLGEG